MASHSLMLLETFLVCVSLCGLTLFDLTFWILFWVFGIAVVVGIVVVVGGGVVVAVVGDVF